MKTIKIIIVDDHPAVRMGLQAILDNYEDLAVIATAESGEELLELCQDTGPDVVLIDVMMPGMSGIETMKMLRKVYPDVQALMLSQSDAANTIQQAMEAGAIGYLVKSSNIDDIAKAIRAAADGRRTLSPEALESLIRSRTVPRSLPDSELTERELEIIDLMVQGMKNPQIAEHLLISTSTVKFHIGSIFRKTGVRTRTEVVVKAISLGLVKHGNG